MTMDVRDYIRSGHEPFSKIMNAAAALQADEQLLLIAPFEPRPLLSCPGETRLQAHGAVEQAR